MRFNKSKPNIEDSKGPLGGYSIPVPPGARSFHLGFLTVVVERIGRVTALPYSVTEQRRSEVEAERARENPYVVAQYQLQRTR